MSQDDQYAGTSAVQERHRFDVGAVESYMRDRIKGFSGPMRVEQFKGGQSNPTFLLKTPTSAYVLRRRPPGQLLPSAHAIDREFVVMSALHGTGVPVPRMHCFCEDESLIGSSFYVMEFVSGRTFWDLTLPSLSEVQRARAFESMCSVIAALHAIDPDKVGLSDYGRGGNYMQRQVARWSKQYRASETEPIDSMERLMEWLPGHIPAGEAVSIVHGDFRLDNLVFHPTEPRVVAVLDWELSTLGHPLADFSYHAMLWDLPPDLRGLSGVDLASLGIPSRDTYIDRYCKISGRPRPEREEWDFFVGYNLFRGAAISQGIMKRAIEGSASSAHALEAGSIARDLADAAWIRVRGLVG